MESSSSQSNDSVEDKDVVILKNSKKKETKNYNKSKFFQSPSEEEIKDKKKNSFKKKILEEKKISEEKKLLDEKRNFDLNDLNENISSHFSLFSDTHFPSLNEKLDLLISFSKPKHDVLIDDLGKEKEKVEHLRNQCVKKKLILNFFY